VLRNIKRVEKIYPRIEEGIAKKSSLNVKIVANVPKNKDKNPDIFINFISSGC
jgi:hypothetical protein